MPRSTTPVVLPAPTDWHNEKQVIAARPFLSLRTLKTWRDKGMLRYSKRGNGKNSMCLYKLADIDAVLDGFVIEPTTGPAAEQHAGATP